MATPAVIQALDRAMEMSTPTVVVYLDAVTLLDSAGLGAIVEGHREAGRLGLGYRIGPCPAAGVTKVLSITGVGGVATGPRLG